jgi:carboxypeptidase D
MLWVEQPVGTGFSTGRTLERNELDVSKTFIGWFKNFIDTFGLHGKKIYITGESYSGFFVPYIADAMFNATDKAYYDVRGTMIYEYVLVPGQNLIANTFSPVINSDQVQTDGM